MCMNSKKETHRPSWVTHIPMTVFTAATIALTIMQHNGMAVYFAVLTCLAFLGSCTTSYIDKDKEDK